MGDMSDMDDIKDVGMGTGISITRDTPHAYGLIADGPDRTVCSKAPVTASRSEAYQSEAELEAELIGILTSQGYTLLEHPTPETVKANLRRQLERLNGISLSDREWDFLYSRHIANPTMGVVDKATVLQRSPKVTLTRDNGSVVNFSLFDREHIHRNSLQVMHQYEESEGRHRARYDVTVLVNGLPLVHIELKRRGVRLEEAFNQITRYQTGSFWTGSGLFEWVQVFVISNGTQTKYYGNTVRYDKSHPGVRRGVPVASFQQTSWWSDAKNARIADLEGFARTFMSQRTLLMVLARYCVLTYEDQPSLLVMRPYQICATEAILDRIRLSVSYPERLGKVDAGGYVWHTMGSGKTLTSFKCSQLAADIPGIAKVVFVVDRRDLDNQTMLEYNRFQDGAVNGTSDTRALDEALRDPERRIVVTTIQKLATLVRRNRTHPAYSRHVVFIFDECHRSQFGKMRADIDRRFRKSNVFGFTGTPIFAENARHGIRRDVSTTEQLFGDRLHTYTIVSAIHDGNVLPFRMFYVDTVEGKLGDARTAGLNLVSGIDAAGALADDRRIANNVRFIVDNYDTQTRARKSDGSRLGSILATDGIPMARKYYEALRRAQDEDARRAAAGEIAPRHRIKVAMIYTYSPNGEDTTSGAIADASMDTARLGESDREALDAAIDDYNREYGTSFSTDAARFSEYYQDVSRRLKNGELDMLVVVDMFLTGFDSKRLGTLWLDKSLRQHGLIQALSRTNRVLDSVKVAGNIVCFRNLRKEFDDAIALFGDEEAAGIVTIRPYAESMAEYEEDVRGFLDAFAQEDGTLRTPMGEKEERRFVGLVGAILRGRNLLEMYPRFADEDPMRLHARMWQDAQGTYLGLRDKFRRIAEAGKVDITDDVVFETRLVEQVEVGIDYIVALVTKARNERAARERDGKAKVTVTDRDVMRAVMASPMLRDKAELVKKFLDRVGITGREPMEGDGSPVSHEDIMETWQRLVTESMRADLDAIIREENLRAGEVRKLMTKSFEAGGVPETGTGVSSCLAQRVSRFASGGASYAEKVQRVSERLQDFYERYHPLTRRYPPTWEDGEGTTSDASGTTPDGSNG